MTSFSRRRLLHAGALAGAGAAMTRAAGPVVAADPPTSTAPATTALVRPAPLEGSHQAAVLAAPARHTALVAFDVVAADRDALRDLLRTLSDRARALHAG